MAGKHADATFSDKCRWVANKDADQWDCLTHGGRGEDPLDLTRPCDKAFALAVAEIERLRDEIALLSKVLRAEVRLPDDVELLKRASQVPYLLENYRRLSDEIDEIACELESCGDGDREIEHHDPTGSEPARLLE